jgi:hypothetical protein
METNKPLQFNSVLGRIKAYQTKLASDASSVQDPADKGTVGIPKDPEATPQKQNMPSSEENNVSNEGAKLEDKQTQPVSTGKNVPSTQDGNSKENVSSPTEPLSKIANRVKAITDKIKSSSDSTPKMVSEKDKAESSASKPKTDKIEGAPTSEENTDKGNKTKPPFGNTSMKEKEAANENLAADISPEALMKLASTILATEGGLAAVEPVLLKAAGVEAASQIIKEAAASYDVMVTQQMELMKAANAQREQEEFYKAAAARELAELDQVIKSASEEDKAQIVKFAKVHGAALENIEHPLLKQAYMQGAADAAAMEDAGGAELPGAEGPASIEQIAQLLEAMVQSGEIDEQTAMAVLQELAGSDEAAAGAPEAGAAEEGAGAADAAAAAASAEKGASVKDKDFEAGSNLCRKLLSKNNK